ncbi:MAG: hypothetical protein AAF938_30170, partial [Myxococcota bacterium]
PASGPVRVSADGAPVEGMSGQVGAGLLDARETLAACLADVDLSAFTGLDAGAPAVSTSFAIMPDGTVDAASISSDSLAGMPEFAACWHQTVSNLVVDESATGYEVDLNLGSPR